MKWLSFLLFLGVLVSCGPAQDVVPSPYAPYSIQAMDYFEVVGLCFEAQEECVPRVNRWDTQQIRVQLQGSWTPSDEQELDNIVAELSGLTNIAITRTTGQGDIRIYFVPQQEFVTHCDTYEQYKPQDGYFQINKQSEDSPIIVGADICIEDQFPPTKKHHLLREELTQSLGVGSDSHHYIDSIFQQSPDYTPTQYAEVDKQVIQILYDSRVRPGMTKEEVRQAVLATPTNTQIAQAGH